MKTAEEWANTYPALEVFWVKQIQLDAYKAGMSEAAELCNDLAKIHVGNTQKDGTRSVDVYNYGIGMEIVNKAILTVRDNKTAI